MRSRLGLAPAELRGRSGDMTGVTPASMSARCDSGERGRDTGAYTNRGYARETSARGADRRCCDVGGHFY